MGPTGLEPMTWSRDGAINPQALRISRFLLDRFFGSFDVFLKQQFLSFTQNLKPEHYRSCTFRGHSAALTGGAA
jgi:hypothetical protein